MFARVSATLLAFAVLAACSSNDGGGTPTDLTDAEAGAAGYSLALNAAFIPRDEQLSFMTPGANVVSFAVDDIVGKPYYFGVYAAGFSPGNDSALWEQWGVVPASLELTTETPATFANGPLDVVFVVYVNTPITDMMLATPRAGDLAAFSLSQDVLPGDPPHNVASLRVNVRDGDAAIEVVNRTPLDPKDTDQVTASFDNTILAVP